MRYRVALAVMAAALLSCLLPSDAYADDLVPDVVGLPLEQAQALLERAGYPADLDYDASKPAGRVFGQTPGGLASRPKGTRVTLNVGGAAPVERPPVDPAPADPTPVQPTPIQPTPAQPKPADGLGAPPGGTLPRDPLDLDDPPAGPGPAPTEPTAPAAPTAPTAPADPTPVAPAPTEPSAPAPSADAVLDALPFAPLPDRRGAEVPDLLGQSREAALSGLRGMAVREEFTLSVPSLVGTVINQFPRPGMNLAPGEAVTIQVAVAESPSIRHRSVPALIGKPLAEIEAALQRFGFSAELRRVPSRSEVYGKAVFQQPMAGSLALEGTAVRVNIGVGDGSAPAAPTAPTAPTPVQPTPIDPAPLDPAPTQPAPVDPNLPPAGVPAQPPLDDTPPTGPTPKPPIDPAPVLPPTAPTPKDPKPVPPPQDPTPKQPEMRTPLVRPTLISPPAGESYPRAYGATFEWTAVKGATGYEWELQEEQPSGAWRKVESTTVKNSRFRPDRMKRGRYRWRVRAVAG
ncbi:MAG: PASTA domain-containing protein, partial [Planctomycetota bacterium]|nr:PASTA domain-containing protein [Planctomycetota bacterium]